MKAKRTTLIYKNTLYTGI